ncbi:11012_t:CDS:2, partial [Gigaspora margarita]
LTKPDTIEEGTHDKWLKIMRNETHRLDLDYYEHSRQDEINVILYIIKSQTRSLGKDPIRERIGVVKLRLKLSDLLIQSIIRGLPSVRKEIES